MRRGLLTLERPGGTEGATERVEDLALAIICNTAPWSYLGNRPIYPSPDASFDTGLDLFALSKLSPPAVTRYATQLLTSTPQRGPGASTHSHFMTSRTSPCIRRFPCPSRWTVTTWGCVRV